MNYDKIERLLNKRRTLKNKITEVDCIEEMDPRLWSANFALTKYSGPVEPHGRVIGMLERDEVLEIVGRFKVKYQEELDEVEKELEKESK